MKKLYQVLWGALFLIIAGGRMARSEQVFFDRVGETSSTIEYINVQIPIDLLAAKETLKSLCRAIEDAHKRFPDYKEAEDHYANKFFGSRCQSLLERVERLINLRHTLPKTKRERRELVTLFTLLVAAIAVSYGIYKLEELTAIPNNANTVKAGKESLDAIGLINGGLETVANSVEDFSRQAADFYFDTKQAEYQAHLLDAAQHHVEALENTMQFSLMGRIHISTLGLIDTDTVAAEISRYSSGTGLLPLAKFPTDWLQHEASFLATSAGFDIFLHIPMVRRTAAMTMYRHVPLPMPLDHDLELEVNPDIDFLAISGDGSFYKTMSAAELNMCRKIGDQHICDHQNVVRKAPKSIESVTVDDDVCAWALFLRKFDYAKKACDAHIKMRSSQAYQLSANMFLLYNHEPEVVRISCRNSSSDVTRNLEVNEATKLPLPAGCQAETSEFIMHASDAGFIAPDERFTRHWSWKEYAEAFTKDIDLHRLKKVSIQGIEAINRQTRIHVSEARNMLNSLEEQEHLNLFSLLHSSSIIFIVLGIIAYIIWNKCCNNPQTQPQIIQAVPSCPNPPGYTRNISYTAK